jgi:hypothetical protein
MEIDAQSLSTRLRPLARLGGPTYARLGEFITMPASTSAE